MGSFEYHNRDQICTILSYLSFDAFTIQRPFKRIPKSTSLEYDKIIFSEVLQICKVSLKSMSILLRTESDNSHFAALFKY